MDEELLDRLAEYASVNMVGRGMPTLIHHAVSDPGRFGFDVAIHLRLLPDIWRAGVSRSKCPGQRRLQRSVVEQLGIVDQDGTGALLDQADEEDDYRGVAEEERSAVEEVAERIRRHLEKKRYLIALENVPQRASGKLYGSDAGTYWDWEAWFSRNFPPPNANNRCRVLLSSLRRQEGDILTWWASRHHYSDGGFSRYDPDGNLWMWAAVVAFSVQKSAGVAVTPDDVIRSLLFWWWFRYWEPVPVEELLSCWVHAEVFVPPQLPSSRPASSTTISPSSSSSQAVSTTSHGSGGGGGGGGGGGAAAARHAGGPREVGKALMEELCRQYLLKVDRREGRRWCREALHEGLRRPITSRLQNEGWRSPNYYWMGTTLEKGVALGVCTDQETLAAFSLARSASIFLARFPDDDEGAMSRFSWSLDQAKVSRRDASRRDDAEEFEPRNWRSTTWYEEHLTAEAAGLLQSLTTLFPVQDTAGFDRDWQQGIEQLQQEILLQERQLQPEILHGQQLQQLQQVQRIQEQLQHLERELLVSISQGVIHDREMPQRQQQLGRQQLQVQRLQEQLQEVKRALTTSIPQDVIHDRKYLFRTPRLRQEGRQLQQVPRLQEQLQQLQLERAALTASIPRDVIHDLKHLLIRTPRLRLLDLSYTRISFLPDFLFFFLPELRVLLLRHCTDLKTLAAPAITGNVSARTKTSFHELRVLDLSNSGIREISDDALLHHMSTLEELLLCQVNSLMQLPTLKALENLRVLRLTHSALEGLLPDEMFACMSRLRILDLSYNPSIKYLPASLSRASSTLEEIHLHGCEGLEHVSNCAGLVLEHMPNLRVFTLSGSPVSRLSLRGCSRLEMIELLNLEQLEVLDLSGTGIKELPVVVFNLRHLRRLDLVGVHKLRKVPWREAKRIPQEFNLDQCNCSLITTRFPSAEEKAPSRDRSIPHIFASDPRILDERYKKIDNNAGDDLQYSINILRLIESFYIGISPCKHQAKEEEKQGIPHHLGTLAQFNYSPYKTILEKAKKIAIKASNLHGGGHLKRHVHVQGGGGVGGAPSLDAAWLFLASTDSLLLHDHHYRDSLTHLNRTGSWNLKSCCLEHCHNMECIFAHAHQFEWLADLWISKLPRLTRVWENVSFSDEVTAFRNLKFVHLEYCPHVVYVFPTKIHLQSLEKLVIRFCPRLKHVFTPPHGQLESGVPQAVLSGLKAMELLELPKLESISRGNVGSPWETWKLKVRGCWKLRELPKLIGHPNAPGKVTVMIDGETLWRKNLVTNNTFTII